MSWNPVLDKVIEVKREYEKLPYSIKISNPTFVDMLEILNRKEFDDIFDCLQINQEEEFVLIRYGLSDIQKGLWDDPNSIYRECRSVVIDLKNECIVIAPFRKFFNLDEVEENSLENIKNKISKGNHVEFSNKLDGSMQCARCYNGLIILTGSMALSPNKSWRIKEGYNMLTYRHVNMLMDYPDITFIFEFISLKDAHVVKYSKEEEGLYLIGARNVITGEEYCYDMIRNFGENYDIKTVEIENVTIEEVLERVKTEISSNKEGWVLNVDGYRVKIKCDDYIKLHKLLDKVSSVNVIIENVAENRIDDMLSKIPESHRDRVEKISNIILNYKGEIELGVIYWYNKAPKYSRKDFMVWVDNNVPIELRGYVKCKYLGKPFNVLKNSGNGYKKISDMGLEDKIQGVM